MTSSIPRDTPVVPVTCSQWLVLADTFPFTGSIMGHRASAALFSPFPTVFSFSFPFHPNHHFYQFTPALCLPFTAGIMSQMWNSPALPSPAHFGHWNLQNEFGRAGLKGTECRAGDGSGSEAASPHPLKLLGWSWVRALGSYPGNWGRLTPVLLLFHPTFICEQSHNPLTPSPLAAQPNSGMNFHPQETWFCFHQFYPALSLLPSCRKQCLTGSTASSNFQEGRNDLYQLGIEPDYV